MRGAASRLLSWSPDWLLAAILPPRIGFRLDEVPPQVAAPDTVRRLYIAPANSAGQAWQWIRAAERNLPGVGAISMATVLDDVFRYPVDYRVPLGVYRWSRRWQRSQRRAVEGRFTHVIVESAKRLFGDVLPGSVGGEIDRLRARSVSVALLFHGSDIRLPSRHAASSPWSPFRDGLWPATSQLEVITSRNADLIRTVGGPVFVSTPDLLIDVPTARWLPVVVDLVAWHTERLPFAHGGLPRVAHAPSRDIVKGSDLVDPVLSRLEAEGLIEYVRVTGIAASEMPDVYRSVDIVLDQFRIGSYGVAACEAMAAQRIVVSHVSEQVREHVGEATGLRLPIVQATADELDATIRAIVADPEPFVQDARAGLGFVSEVHDGRRSARELQDFLATE
jgi:hypothetical protein